MRYIIAKYRLRPLGHQVNIWLQISKTHSITTCFLYRYKPLAAVRD